MITKEQIGANIRARRKDLKISQKELARMLNIKDDTIRSVEHGSAYVNLKRLLQVCEALELEISLTPLPKSLHVL